MFDKPLVFFCITKTGFDSLKTTYFHSSSMIFYLVVTLSIVKASANVKNIKFLKTTNVFFLQGLNLIKSKYIVGTPPCRGPTKFSKRGGAWQDLNF